MQLGKTSMRFDVGALSLTTAVMEQVDKECSGLMRSRLDNSHECADSFFSEVYLKMHVFRGLWCEFR